MGRAASEAERAWRQKEVTYLVGRNLTTREIADKLGTTATTINNDRRVLGITGERIIFPHVRNLRLKQRTEARIHRQSKVLELSDGHKALWIARELGVHISTIRKDFQALGISRGNYSDRSIAKADT